MDDLNQVLRVRREKLQTLHDRGIEPFAYNFDPSHRAAEAVRGFEAAESTGDLSENGEGGTVRVGGRLVAWRSHGKSAFAHLEDASGQIQLYFKKDVLGEASFADLDLLDLGDWIGVDGPLFRTRMGEITVSVRSWKLLSKSLRPLPFGKVETDAETGERTVHSGFADTESRYRQRYADLAVHPEVREVFRTRARVVNELRAFLDAEGFLEVETPALQPLYGGASARPFVTTHNALDRTMYLRIADELYLKRLIVGGLDRVYEISKDFRNEGIDRFHNPEFTMLEWYQAFSDYEDQMDLVERLVVHVADRVLGRRSFHFGESEISVEPPFRRIRLVDALSEALGDDVNGMTDLELRRRAEGLSIPDLGGAGRGKLIDKLFGELVEPSLVQPTFVMDHPKELSPLAKPKRGEPELTERFELYMAGMELFNAFSELNDPLDQRQRFEAQAGLRAAGDDEAQQVDEDYLRAMEYGMPPTGGVGMGVDRFVMLLTNQASIRDVILFPILRGDE
ncbi:MAG TPA: lysine--tRNA ligase [Longimicrobiales bacterium]|nr:lysine--tRNA ligase [Longimicrobiales bacterium]